MMTPERIILQEHLIRQISDDGLSINTNEETHEETKRSVLGEDVERSDSGEQNDLSNVS
jgi:hypothetical protein